MTFGQWVKYVLLMLFRPNSITRKEWQMLIYLNRDRADFELSKLGMQEDLRDVARKHSKDMAKKDYFDHQNFRGESPADRLKVSRVTDSVSGENLAKIGGYPHVVKEAEEGLMRSPGHRANILNKSYNTVGIGIVQSKEKVYYFTQNFAKRIIKFTKKVHKTISLKKGLPLKGFTFEEMEHFYYQVKEFGHQKVLKEGLVKVSGKRFKTRIVFDSVGKFEVYIYVHGSGKKLNLANHFDVGVRGWWFWR
ncbi:CAP domain-containing protein [Candidatus Peregrinibacteria bacterium]|jgi:hypothetical protein|nr:CAP domain-containing protein [Candidatus Peregrinibacteria bacterium]